jgi:hypothetical protein
MPRKSLIVPSDFLGSSDWEAIENVAHLVYRRDSGMAPDLYYETLLETLKKQKSIRGALRMILWERGEPLAERDSTPEKAIFLLQDVNGLLFQPSCRTVDEAGGLKFPDAAELFDPNWTRQAEQALGKAGFRVQVCLGGAVPAPRLLTPAEKAVLSGWGAGIAVRHLYLEARAARASGATALGIAVPRSLDVPSCLKALTILSTME